MTGVQLDAVARDYISKHGYEEAFGHSTGHGIGLEIRRTFLLVQKSNLYREM